MKADLTRAREGQALIEMLVSAGLVGIVLYGGARMLRAGLDQLRCSRMAFESGHERLMGEVPGPASPVRVRSRDGRIIATAHCGELAESAGFTELEARQRGGFALLPLAFLAAALATAALGVLGLQETWRRQVEVQLRLDRCAAHAALLLARIQGSISRENQRITLTRAAKATALAAGQGQIAAAASAALEVMARSQDLQRMRWVAAQARLSLQRGCRLDPLGRYSRPGPLPWHRPPPDPIGLRPLEWPAKMPSRIAIHFRHQNRSSHAAVRRQESEWIASYDVRQTGRLGPF